MTISPNKRLAVLTAHGYTCALTGYKGDDLDVDHIDPASKGGSDDFDNLVPLNRTVNIIKNNNDVRPAIRDALKKIAEQHMFKCAQAYEQASHLKRMIPKNDPANIDFERLKKHVGDTDNWKASDFLRIVWAYMQKSYDSIVAYAKAIGKSLTSVRAKLVNMKIYNPEYLRLV